MVIFSLEPTLDSSVEMKMNSLKNNNKGNKNKAQNTFWVFKKI